jgi:hypothetical protein
MIVAAASPRPGYVADHDRVPALGQSDDVVPVAADFQGDPGRLVPHGQASGQICRPEDGTLQGERYLALLLVRPGTGERPLQVRGQLSEQGAVKGGERPW